MRVCALLAFFREDADWLHDCVSSLGFCSDVIALGGAYKAFPHAEDSASLQERKAIKQAATKAGVTPWIYSGQLWKTEMEKRTALFRHGDTLGVDWFFVIDADEVVLSVPPDLPEVLSALDTDAAEVSLREPIVHQSDESMVLTSVTHIWRMLFRAIPGLKVTDNHHSYVAPDGRNLWGSEPNEEPARRIEEFVVEHRLNLRDSERKAQANTYYRRRNELKLEKSYG